MSGTAGRHRRQAGSIAGAPHDTAPRQPDHTENAPNSAGRGAVENLASVPARRPSGAQRPLPGVVPVPVVPVPVAPVPVVPMPLPVVPVPVVPEPVPKSVPVPLPVCPVPGTR
ncbi:MAG: hypothetical protein EHM78_20250 [Myxococcaceae bacterium]|nr:MAG: hypothetical protein EHM78_20250 [Myxococcaceae bacterium]